MDLDDRFSLCGGIVGMIAGAVTNPPAFNFIIPLLSAVVPMPTRKVPLITVTFSSVGWVCGAMR